MEMCVCVFVSNGNQGEGAEVGMESLSQPCYGIPCLASGVLQGMSQPMPC